jgi:hypothetical protein
MATEAIIFTQIVDINWDQAIYTASPNNTINVAQFAAKGSGTNIGIALTPKGTGYISAQVPDGTTAGGNARGAKAVDLQTSRTAASQVASGEKSVIIGGQNNTASGVGSCVFSSRESTASGEYSTVISARASTASGFYSTVIGQLNTASGAYSVAAGIIATAAADYSFAFGLYARTTAGTRDTVAIGRSALAHINSQFSIGSAEFATDGDNQTTVVQNRGKTTNDVETEILVHGTNRFVLRSGSIASGIIAVVGSKSDGSAVARYLRQVTIKRVGSTTSLVGSVATLGTDEAAGTSINITADDTNESLKVAVTGIASETWRWHAVFIGNEMIFGA